MTKVLRTKLLAASLTVVLAACSNASMVKPVAMSVNAQMRGDILQISGLASVPDDAWVDYVAYQSDAPALRVSGHARVEDGRFNAQATLPHWPPGKITVDANFQMGQSGSTQPAAIVALFGKNGEHMRGPSVVKGGGTFRAATASITIDDYARD